MAVDKFLKAFSIFKNSPARRPTCFKCNDLHESRNGKSLFQVTAMGWDSNPEALSS